MSIETPLHTDHLLNQLAEQFERWHQNRFHPLQISFGGGKFAGVKIDLPGWSRYRSQTSWLIRFPFRI